MLKFLINEECLMIYFSNIHIKLFPWQFFMYLIFDDLNIICSTHNESQINIQQTIFVMAKPLFERLFYFEFYKLKKNQ